MRFAKKGRELGFGAFRWKSEILVLGFGQKVESVRLCHFESGSRGRVESVDRGMHELTFGNFERLVRY